MYINILRCDSVLTMLMQLAGASAALRGCFVNLFNIHRETAKKPNMYLVAFYEWNSEDTLGY